MSTEIKAGDIVRCISTGNNSPGIITLGKLYTVIEVDQEILTFTNDLGDTDMFGKRFFELFKSAEIASGTKRDEGKPNLEYIPREALEGAGRAFGFGARKYAPHNFKLGLAYSRLAGAIMRHLTAFMDNEDLDPESGLSHLDHLLSSASMLKYMEVNRKDMDDRFNKQTGKLNNE